MQVRLRDVVDYLSQMLGPVLASRALRAALDTEAGVAAALSAEQQPAAARDSQAATSVPQAQQEDVASQTLQVRPEHARPEYHYASETAAAHRMRMRTQCSALSSAIGPACTTCMSKVLFAFLESKAPQRALAALQALALLD